jgi:hypothetical protein
LEDKSPKKTLSDKKEQGTVFIDKNDLIKQANVVKDLNSDQKAVLKKLKETLRSKLTSKK